MTPRLLSTLALAAALTGCATSPTGQNQLLLFPDSEMARMGVAAFEQTKQQTPETRDEALRRYVDCVAAPIAREADPTIPWEVRVFESPDANAFALPGGKIGVYTGILDVAETPDQLAAVLGHEVVHVTAQHGNARVSAAYATQAGLQVTQALAGASGAVNPQLIGLLGAGAQYGLLMPYNRGQETEADIVGLDLMARVGFDPRAAVDLWDNMRAASGGREPPVFLSTHPSNAGRIRELESRMPRALQLYDAARAAGRRPTCRRP